MAIQLTKRNSIVARRHERFATTEQQKLSKVLRKMCLLLQFLGVLPVLGNSKFLNYLQRIWCAALLLTISFMTIRKSLLLDSRITTLQKGFYLSELIFLVVLPLNIFILNFTHKEKFLSICEKFQLLKQQLKLYNGAIKRPSKSIDYRLRMELLLLTYGLILFYALCICLNFIANKGSVLAVLKVWSTYHLGNIIMNGNLGLYWFSIRAISLAIGYSNRILKSFREDHSTYGLNSSHEVSQTSMKALWFQKEFGCMMLNKFWKFDDVFVNITEINFNLDQLMREIVDIFRIILIMYFINSFLILVLHFFLIYKYFDNPDVRIFNQFLLKCARLGLNVFNIAIILVSHNSIINQVSFEFLE